MAADSLFSTVEWMWKSNLNPYSWTVEAEWRSYTEEQNASIEEAYQNDKEGVLLKTHYIDFAREEQMAIDDPTRRRPVKRVVHDKGIRRVLERFSWTIDYDHQILLSPTNKQRTKRLDISDFDWTVA